MEIATSRKDFTKERAKKALLLKKHPKEEEKENSLTLTIELEKSASKAVICLTEELSLLTDENHTLFSSFSLDPSSKATELDVVCKEQEVLGGFSFFLIKDTDSRRIKVESFRIESSSKDAGLPLMEAVA